MCTGGEEEISEQRQAIEEPACSRPTCGAGVEEAHLEAGARKRRGKGSYILFLLFFKGVAVGALFLICHSDTQSHTDTLECP